MQNGLTILGLPSYKEDGQEVQFSRERACVPFPYLPWLFRVMEEFQEFPQSPVGDKVSNRIGSLGTCYGRASVVRCDVTLTSRMEGRCLSAKGQRGDLNDTWWGL